MDIKKIKRSLMCAGFAAIAAMAIPTAARMQTPVPSPSPSPEPEGRFSITSTIEVGVRGLEVNGDHEKYRSDLNYHSGVRVFDSSFMIEDNAEHGRLFDSLLFTSTGWGADPHGSFRFNMDKAGIYKFDSNVRRVRYFNSLRNIATSEITRRGQHNFNTLHHFGDFDLTIFPERELRFKIGYSFNNTDGPGTYTLRFPTSRGEEFMVDSQFKNSSQDLRLGVEGTVLGFNWGVNYGHRKFKDETRFFVNTLNFGNDPAPSSAYLNTLSRLYPTDGKTNYGNFFIQRTFARRLDFTGRFIYAESDSETFQSDIINGKSNPQGSPATQYFYYIDQINAPGEAKRPQARGDLGLTYRVTDDFRISNTFTFDQYSIAGGNRVSEFIARRTLTGTEAPPVFTDASSWRATGYRRFSNLIEADYQFSRWLGVNIGYRYTDRKVGLDARDINLLTGAVTFTEDEEFQNKTHTIIAGAKIKPTKNWSIYADVERGESDNVFTRLANGDFFNFRVRSIANIKRFTFNVSAITKDVDNPGVSSEIRNATTGVILFPATETVANAKSRFFSASVDWNASDRFSISGGYTYNKQDSSVDILVPVNSVWFLGRSEYYVRDSYFFFDVSARPIDRIGLYASYRINDDNGQGDRVSTRPQDFISSYPIRYQTPEIKLAIKITRNIDWNIGYQYYDYKETPTHFPFIAQNYTAHLPYTSLRWYFGRSADR